MNRLIIALRSLNKCDIYVFLWCLVGLEGILHIEGAISQGIQAILLVWAVYEGGIYLLPDKRHPLVLQATSILLFMYFVYGMIFIIFSPPYFPDVHYVYFKSFLSSFIPLYLFYKYSKEGLLTERRIILYFIIILVVTVFQFFHLSAILSKKNDSQGATNNIGYRFLSLLPLCFFLYKKRTIQYITIGVIMFFIFMSVKRGAIMIGTVCFIWFLRDSIIKATSIKHKYATLLFGMILVFFSVVTISYQLANNDFINRRIADTENGNSSGRDKLYLGVIEAVVNDDSYLHLIFGRGAYATFDVIHKMAHNDWLETACNNGLIGVSCLIYFLYAFFKTSIVSKRYVRPEISSVMNMMFFIYLAKMFFSMSLQGMSISITMLIAYFAASIQEKTKIN